VRRRFACNSTAEVDATLRRAEAPANRRRRAGATLWLVAVVAVAGCRPLAVNGPTDRLMPSNFRNWSPQYARLPTAEIDGRSILIRNVRNNQYVSDQDFVLQYEDRRIELDDVESVDFIVVPFRDHPYLAHTMLSFGLRGGTYLAVSAEVRTEKGEAYSPTLGMARQYELTYVIADERDLVRLRTRHREADVYVYPTVATASDAQQLFVDLLQRANELAEKPEFYNTLTNNCTTTVLDHTNKLRGDERLPFHWQILLPGYSDRFAFDHGLLRNDVPFEELRRVAHVNQLAEQHYDDPEFSQKIRAGRGELDEIARRPRQPVSQSSRRPAFPALQALESAANRIFGMRR